MLFLSRAKRGHKKVILALVLLVFWESVKKALVLLLFSSHESVKKALVLFMFFHMQKVIPTRAVL